MSTKNFKLWRQGIKRLLPACLLIAVAMFFTGNSLHAGGTATTLAGGKPSKYYGFVNTTILQSLFHTPCGLSMDSSGTYLFVADQNNDAIRYLDFGDGLTWTDGTNSLNKPVGVIYDNNTGNIIVLNKGNGSNGNVLTIAGFQEGYYEVVATNAVNLVNANSMTRDNAGNLYITASNTIVKVTTNGVQSNLVTISIPGTDLSGIVSEYVSGTLAVCDAGRDGIYNVNPVSGVFTTNAGFNGAGDFVTNGVNLIAVNFAKFRQPEGIVEAGDGSLVVADYGNNRLKVITGNVVTNLEGITQKYWHGPFPGWEDGSVIIPDSYTTNAESREPFGVTMGPDGTIYMSEDYYHTIRKVTGASLGIPPPPPPAAPQNLQAIGTITSGQSTGQVSLTWSPTTTATNYYVERSPSSGGPYTLIGTTTSTSFIDTNNIFAGGTYYYVVQAVNTGGLSPDSAEVSVTLPLPTVPNPQIGFVTFPFNPTLGYDASVFQDVPVTFTFNNDADIVIVGTPGYGTYYTYGATTDPSTVPNPTTNSASVDSAYKDGQSVGTILPFLVVQEAPSLVVKAIGAGNGATNSAVTTAQFSFVTANPSINGNNPAQFYITDITTNATLYYTLDGTDPSPTNGVSLGTVPLTTNAWTVSVFVNTNTLFEVRAFRNNYQPSQIVSAFLSPSNIIANTISFGFSSGEASSEFIGSPGETFYAPVTLTTLPGTPMYALQFNLTVSNFNGSPAVTPGAYGFSSMLEKPIPNTNPTLYTNIPPAMFVGPNFTFTNLEVVNTNLNQIALGWVERAGETNLYNTIQQTLITYSQAHDDLFPSRLQPQGVIVGGYGFQIPPNATPGQQYMIQIGRASGSSDGIGTPGSSIYISTPTNGALGAGAINALKLVTVGQSLYLVGDAYPFSWFNAGDFGSGELVTNGASDVEQVFESAAYGLNTPPTNTDFFDCMDSAGNYGIYDTVDGYYTNGGNLNPAQQAALYNNSDPSEVNSNLFGDGVLDVADVYTTYIRSVSATNQNYNLLWVQRFWTNGIRAALYTGNPSFTINRSLKSPNQTKGLGMPTYSPTNQPMVNFWAGDFQGSPGQTVQIPINASVVGIYPLRVLLLNLSVIPLDGSPALTSAVTFTPVSSLGSPSSGYTEQRGLGNYSAAWLNNSVSGLTGSNVIGFLSVTIPSTATSLSSYAIHFDHASGSPSGFASFPKQTLTGVLTLSSRTNSTYSDGIPDSWRLRWFGTVYNVLSESNAIPDGDGITAWQKYVAGVDPTIPNDFPAVLPVSPAPSGYKAIHWPSVYGKNYVIMRSSNLFAPAWSVLSTNTGTGDDMQYNDNSSGQVQFYRVQIQHP